MIRLRICGLQETLPEAAPTTGIKVMPIAAFRFGTVRGETASVITQPVDDDAVVELEFDNGLRLWVRADQLDDEFKGAPGRRGFPQNGEPDVVAVPPVYPRRNAQEGASRGVGAWTLRMLRIFDVDPAGMVAKELARVVDDHAVAAPGLHRWRRDGSLEPVADPGALTGGRAILLFLHGTASSTEGSFGGLRTHASVWPELHKIYGDRILALEHRTFSDSPIDNAIDALNALPENATLHLVSHSRGGLIGELLCRGILYDDEGKARDPFMADELALFDPAQRERLSKLAALIKSKNLQITRFVRVACPARGTTLASERLDRWLSILTNLIGLVPVFSSGPLYGAIRDFTLAVVKERLNAGSVPGLEAMVPNAPLQRVINRVGVTTNADLSIIKGDMEGAGILGSLKALATDLYFREDHDLVVNTSAMDGGTRRKAKHARFHFDQGTNVDHFSYFRNVQTAVRVLEGLRRGDADDGGFLPLDDGEEAIIPAGTYAKRDVRQPTVFVLPGITGSVLKAAGDTIWLSPLRLAGGGLKKLEMGATVEAAGLLARYYGNLIEHLQSTHAVKPFPYDWRLPIQTEARRFASALNECLAASDPPVRIVAHSMGGLVARAALAMDANLRSRFEAREGCRLIMLGTPNHGSHSIPLMLMGRDQMMQMLAVVDFTMNAAEHLAIVSRFPGVLDLLPDAPAATNAFDFFSQATWKALQIADRQGGQWVVPADADLRQAAGFRKWLNSFPLDPARMFYVAGQNLTPTGVVVDHALGTVGFIRSQRGDGRVPWDTGFPKDLQVWYTSAAHGDLANHAPAFFAITDLLERGDTARLPKTPSLSRDVAEPPSIERETMEVFPDAADLAAAAIGGRIRAPESKGATRTIDVRVVHASLVFARHPLMVGHYAGDTIAGPEAHIDRLLGGRLSLRRSLGLYPNDIATAEVLFDEGSCERGVVVVGLGHIGKLSSGDLQRTLTHGLLRYAAACRDLPGAATGPLRLSTLLVGCGSGGVALTVGINALLRALQRAQAALGREGFDEIEVIELYEHRAIQTWHEINRAVQSSDLSRQFRLCSDVQHGEGGRRRVAEDGDSTWWQPMTVTMEDVGRDGKVMRFIIPTGMARAEAIILPAQQSLVDRFMEQAIAANVSDDGFGTPGRTLFELLVPNQLKDQMREDRPLRLVLDSECAHYPWELMDDRRPWLDDGSPTPGGLRKPLSVRAGLIRQLMRQTFRQRLARPAGTDKALVIGNTMAGDPKLDLPGASAEGEAVADLLSRHGYEVTRLLDEVSPERVLMALCAQDWKVVHIAAHGVVDDSEGRTGIVLGGGLVLTADMLGQLLPLTPELVFVNCCHLGGIPSEREKQEAAPWLTKRSRLAANIAVKLIDIGVGAVIAAGWAVNDAAARSFAEVFYAQLLDPARPATLGTAVLKAREAVYDGYQGTTTWGAYQAYGEPDWRLYAQGWNDIDDGRGFASIVEAIDAVDLVRQDAQTGIVRDVSKAVAELQAIEREAKSVGRMWMKDATLLTALGSAYGELGDLATAVEYYRAAVRCDPAHAPVQAIEQLTNLTVRLAVQEYKRDRAANRQDCVLRIIRMVNLIDGLEGVIGRSQTGAADDRFTVERWVLRGACYKRLAQIEVRETIQDRRAEALDNMADAYGKARDLFERRNPQKINPYPRLMHLTARVLSNWRSGTLPRMDADMETSMLEALSVSVERDKDDPSFWHALPPADATLLRHLAQGKLGPEERRQIKDRYLQAWRRGGSQLKLVSVFEQLDFITDVLEDGVASNAAERNDMRQSVILLRQELEQATRW